MARLFMKKDIHAKFKKSHKSAKKRIRFFANHPFALPVTTFFVMVFFGLGMFVAVGASTVGANDKRIVDVYVDGEARTVTTRAKTVGELIERLEVPLIEEDRVEPSLDSIILEDNTQVNVFRARPVEVIDGDRTITLLTAQRAPRLIAYDAGMNLFPEDNVYLRGPDGSRLSSSFGERLVIERAIPIQLNVYSVVSTQRTSAKTVGEFLEQNAISVEEGATVQPANLDTAITKDLLIAVNKIGIVTESVVEPVAFDTETREDDSLSVGESVVQQEGSDGERTVVYEITIKDEVEVGRREIQSIVTRDPITKIVLRGKKPAVLSSSLNVSGDKQALMAAAGIAPVDYPYVDYIISRESGWRPGAVNSSSGAYGLCQSLPASKMASAGADYLTNPVTQLRWCSGYAAGRYGGWQGAYNAWLVQHWW